MFRNDTTEKDASFPDVRRCLTACVRMVEKRRKVISRSMIAHPWVPKFKPAKASSYFEVGELRLCSAVEADLCVDERGASQPRTAAPAMMIVQYAS